MEQILAVAIIIALIVIAVILIKCDEKLEDIIHRGDDE